MKQQLSLVEKSVFVFFTLATACGMLLMSGCSSSNESELVNQLQQQLKSLQSKVSELETKDQQAVVAIQALNSQVETLTRENNALKGMTDRSLTALIKANREIVATKDSAEKRVEEMKAHALAARKQAAASAPRKIASKAPVAQKANKGTQKVKTSRPSAVRKKSQSPAFQFDEDLN